MTTAISEAAEQTQRSDGTQRTSAGVAPRWRRWTAIGLSAVPVLLMLGSAGAKLAHAPPVVEKWVGPFGFQESSLTAIGILELSVVLLYAFPRTAVLGAMLLTGYLGGAITVHVRVGDPFLAPLVLGVLAWVGLYLREPRLHALMPLRSPPSSLG